MSRIILFSFCFFFFFADKKKARTNPGTACAWSASGGRAHPPLGADKPVGPHRHVLDLAIGQPCALDHPAHVILIVDLDIALVAMP